MAFKSFLIDLQDHSNYFDDQVHYLSYLVSCRIDSFSNLNQFLADHHTMDACTAVQTCASWSECLINHRLLVINLDLNSPGKSLGLLNFVHNLVIQSLPYSETDYTSEISFGANLVLIHCFEFHICC